MSEPRQRQWSSFADLPDWMSEAGCLDAPHEWFFPDRGGQATKARRICWTACEVRTDCLSYAVKTNQRWGIWGGLNAKERRKVKQERAA